MVNEGLDTDGDFPCAKCAALPTDDCGDTIGELCKRCQFYPYSKMFPYPCENVNHQPMHMRINPGAEYNRIEAAKERGFCNKCRWDWLRSEAARLMEEANENT
jgi:hypothetical protein